MIRMPDPLSDTPPSDASFAGAGIPCPPGVRGTRILVSHTYPLVNCGLERVLGAMAHIDVTTDEADAFHPPDIVVADYHDGVERAARARREVSFRRVLGPRVVIVTERCREQDVRLALAAGVSGYLQQDCTPAALAECIRQVAKGQRHVGSELALRMVDGLTAEALTGRESEVLSQVARGRCNNAIGNELGISVGTVKAHMQAILAKLQASSRTEAASIALQRGLVDLQPPARRAMPLAFTAP